MPNENLTYVVETIQQAVDAISAKLGVALPQLWAVLIKQAGIDAQFAVYEAWALGILSGVLFVLATWMLRSERSGAVFVFIVALLTFTGTVFDIHQSLTCSQNPEYCAMKEIAAYLPKM